MALTNKSLFLYGFQVTTSNNSLDFQAVLAGPTLLATLNIGFYSLTSLAAEISRAMNAADPSNFYTVLTNRTISAGTQNRVTIQTSGSHLSLLFGSGPRNATTCAPLIGFNSTDYTGLLSYQGATSAGTPLLSAYPGYTFLDTSQYQKIYGAVNISTSGVKEAITFANQFFLECEYKFETKSAVLNNWNPWFMWAIQQKPFDYTPDINFPDIVYSVTLDKSSGDGQGLGFKWKEMLSDFAANYYQTGVLTFRVQPIVSQFVGG